MPIKTILYGGAFDPPHPAHANVAKLALKTSKYDDLWFVPNNSNAFSSYNKPVASFEHRVKMLELLLLAIGDTRMFICDIEREMRNEAGVYSVIKTIIENNKNREFAYLIGSDQALRIRNWKHSRDLVKTLPFFIAERRFFNMPWDSWCRTSPGHLVIGGIMSLTSYSSSTIREEFYKNRDNFVDNKHPNLHISISSYIIRHDLYKK